MKTPLLVIQSYAMVLQKAELSPDYAQEYIATIGEAPKKLDSLITNALQYYRTETIYNSGKVVKYLKIQVGA